MKLRLIGTWLVLLPGCFVRLELHKTLDKIAWRSKSANVLSNSLSRSHCHSLPWNEFCIFTSMCNEHKWSKVRINKINCVNVFVFFLSIFLPFMFVSVFVVKDATNEKTASLRLLKRARTHSQICAVFVMDCCKLKNLWQTDWNRWMVFGFCTERTLANNRWNNTNEQDQEFINLMLW